MQNGVSYQSNLGDSTHKENNYDKIAVMKVKWTGKHHQNIYCFYQVPFQCMFCYKIKLLDFDHIISSFAYKILPVIWLIPIHITIEICVQS